MLIRTVSLLRKPAKPVLGNACDHGGDFRSANACSTSWVGFAMSPFHFNVRLRMTASSLVMIGATRRDEGGSSRIYRESAESWKTVP
jgi:hypothetical protein